MDGQECLALSNPASPSCVIASWQCQAQRGQQVFAPRCVTSAVPCQDSISGQLAESQGYLMKWQWDCGSRKSYNSVTRNLMQSEGCLEVFQNTDFNTIKTSKREDTGQTALTASPIPWTDHCCQEGFISSFRSAPQQRRKRSHASNPDSAQEVAEVPPHLPAGALPRDWDSSWVTNAVILFYFL